MSNTDTPHRRPICTSIGRAYRHLTLSSRGFAVNLGLPNIEMRIVWRLSWRWIATRMDRRWQGKEREV